MKLRISQGEVHGEDIFRLMDSRGLPLELLVETFRKKGIRINIDQLIDAALASGNYTAEKIKARIMEAFRYVVSDRGGWAQFSERLDRAYP
jgi:alanyl-tRNA synthetase